MRPIAYNESKLKKLVLEHIRDTLCKADDGPWVNSEMSDPIPVKILTPESKAHWAQPSTMNAGIRAALHTPEGRPVPAHVENEAYTEETLSELYLETHFKPKDLEKIGAIADDDMDVTVTGIVPIMSELLRKAGMQKRAYSPKEQLDDMMALDPLDFSSNALDEKPGKTPPPPSKPEFEMTFTPGEDEEPVELPLDLDIDDDGDSLPEFTLSGGKGLDQLAPRQADLDIMYFAAPESTGARYILSFNNEDRQKLLDAANQMLAELDRPAATR